MENLENWIPHLAALAGLFGGIAVAWFLCRGKAATLQARFEERDRAAHKAVVDLEAACANLEAEVRQLRATEANSLKRQSELEALLHSQQRAIEDKQQMLREAEHRMSQNFQALSAEALRSSQQEFLELARATFDSQQREATSELEQRRVAVETLVKPVAATLNKVESRIGELEQARHESEATIVEQVRRMASAQAGLQKETANLAKALRQPAGRGRWGELQLQRVVELAGMNEHCDFLTPTDADRKNRPEPLPDLVVKLPTGRLIAVDAQAPLEAYLAAIEAETEAQTAEHMKRHAALVGQHLTELASPAYRDQFRKAPEFIVLFLPSESIFSAALSADPGLLERGIEQGVILATPTTLVALLRAAAVGWRQEDVADKARQVSEVGRELHAHVSSLAGRFAQVGRSLDSTVRNYNLALGSLEGNVLPEARKLSDLGAVPADDPLAAGPQIDRIVHQAQHDLSALPLTERGPEASDEAHPSPRAEDGFEGFVDAVPQKKTRVKIKPAPGTARNPTEQSPKPATPAVPTGKSSPPAIVPQKKAG